jgi:SagB-type dehydrogenase family enzyme
MDKTEFRDFKEPVAVENVGKLFMEHTKYRYLSVSDQAHGVPQPPLELPCNTSNAFFDLPNPDTIRVKDIALQKAIENRRSERNFSNTPLSLEELSYLLWCTQGVKRVVQNHVTFRTVPSAGARHALETFLLINNVDTLRPGIYRFGALEHRLVEMKVGPGVADSISRACFDQEFVKEGAATFIWIAVVYRMKWRYGERGYRYLHLDAGHTCQNLYLCAQSIDCGVCAIAAFSDDDMNALLGLDGEEQFVIYIAAVGKK